MKQQEHLKIYDLTLTTRGPVFIGNGQKSGKKEYLFDPSSGRISFINEEKLFDLLIEKGLVEEFERYSLAPNGTLWAFLKYTCRLGNEEIRALQRYSVMAGGILDEKHTLKDIQRFQRDPAGNAYVPGSSVKGALRTALLLQNVLADQTPLNLRSDQTYSEERYLHTLGCKKNKDGSIDQRNAVNSILRGVQISDSDPIPDNALTLAGKVDLFPNGYAKQVSVVYRECAAPGTVLRFRLTLDESVLKGRITAEGLLAAVKGSYADHQARYLSKFAPAKGQMAVSAVHGLYLGGGTGFFSKSLAYPYLGKEAALPWVSERLARSFRKHRHAEDTEKYGISPRTLKLAKCPQGLYPMGLCEVDIR